MHAGSFLYLTLDEPQDDIGRFGALCRHQETR
jgi:hypothetical protein